MSMASMTASELYLMSLDDLHEGGCGVHAPAEAVGLPADDGVEAFPPGVGQHPLELRALLGPSPAHLLVSGRDGQALALAVGFHLACLLGDGGLVVLGLALDHHLDLGGAPGRANTGDKMLTLVASALAGGDCIDEADALRAGGTVGVLGCVVKASSTLGTFLRSFRWGMSVNSTA